MVDGTAGALGAGRAGHASAQPPAASPIESPGKSMGEGPTGPQTDADGPFADLDESMALPRLVNLALSPDGSELVLEQYELDERRTGYRGALWIIDADGTGQPRQVTSPVWSSGNAAYTSSGDLLFVSARSPHDGSPARPQVWRLPRGEAGGGTGGEAHPLTDLADGVDGIIAVAAAAPVAILAGTVDPLDPAGEGTPSVAELRAERGITAILHESYPTREKQRDIGREQVHLFALDLAMARGTRAPDAREKSGSAAAPSTRDLTADSGAAAGLREPRGASAVVTPDGATAFCAWRVPERRGYRTSIVTIDVATGQRTAFLDLPGIDLEPVLLSDDGTRLVFRHDTRSTPTEPYRMGLWTVDLDGTNMRPLFDEIDPLPWEAVAGADGRSVLITADHRGRTPIFVLDVDTGALRKVTDDEFCYSSLAAEPTGKYVYALRSSVREPSHPVRVDLGDGSVLRLPTPAPAPATHGAVTDFTTRVGDGDGAMSLQGWLVTPVSASADEPAPLLVYLHGGPTGAWGTWMWGAWNPWPAVARGYAVLLANPSLSTGFGEDYIRRGWGEWGGETISDLFALVDAVCDLDLVDGSRTALLGCSHGGYVTNWVAGHSDRFDAIVTHAGIWDLEQFLRTTDIPNLMDGCMSPENNVRYSPRYAVRNISTPMLITHGGMDYRIPVTEAISQWSELHAAHADEDDASPHKFLYFPDEGHGVARPQNLRLWHQTVHAFLDTHLRQQPWVRPELLR